MDRLPAERFKDAATAGCLGKSFLVVQKLAATSVAKKRFFLVYERLTAMPSPELSAFYRS
jgi:hypothetical protein